MRKQLSSEIAALQQRARTLAADRQRLDALLQTALARERRAFDEAEVREIRTRIHRLTETASTLTDRIVALEALRPSAEAVEAAAMQADVLREELDVATREFAYMAENYSKAVDGARECAEALCAARNGCHELRNRLVDVVADFQLPVSVPAPIELESDEGNRGMVVGLLVSQAAHGEPSDVIMRDLKAVRMRVASRDATN